MVTVKTHPVGHRTDRGKGGGLNKFWTITCLEWCILFKLRLNMWAAPADFLRPSTIWPQLYIFLNRFWKAPGENLYIYCILLYCKEIVQWRFKLVSPRIKLSTAKIRHWSIFLHDKILNSTNMKHFNCNSSSCYCTLRYYGKNKATMITPSASTVIIITMSSNVIGA